MLAVPRELAGLKSVSLTDQDTFVSAAEQSDQKSWLYYFPFLYGFSQGVTQTLLWEAYEGSICLYYLKRGENGFRLHPYLPPFPFCPKAVKHALARTSDYNGSRSSKIIWLDESQRALLAGMGFDFELIEEEYIYDSELVRSRQGSNFARLRHKVNQACRIEGLLIRSYRKDDEEACLNLYDNWRRYLREERNVRVAGQTYQRHCITDAMSFKDSILQGEVILIKDCLCAFTFGGRIASSYGSLFVAISDHSVPGLGYVQRAHLVSNIKGVRYFNDSSDVQRAGLAEVKKAFNPVAMNALYRARLPSRRV
jgi:hypothetical protein